MRNATINIKIAGDLVINKKYGQGLIDSNLIEHFGNSDFNIVNLESPITTSTSKILKTGPHLKGDTTSTQEVLHALKIDLVTLANNHILDYDEQGVNDTIEFCERHNIAFVGAGSNLANASKTFYLEEKNKIIGIVNFAENEWASAKDNSAGANPMALIDNVKQIKEAKSKADLVFVIVHGGHEYYNLPSPRMTEQYRFYVDNGADLVVGHHTHCISGYEIYNGVAIYYSLGNFLFTKPSDYKDWHKGIVLDITINEDNSISTIPHFVMQEPNTFQLSLVAKEELVLIQNRFQEYSNIIKDDSLLEEAWKLFINKNYENYYYAWSPYSFIGNRYIRGIIWRLGISFKNRKARATFLNFMRCEAHSDLSKEVLEKYLKQ